MFADPRKQNIWDELTDAGFMDKVKQGRDNYYINLKLLEILTDYRLLYLKLPTFYRPLPGFAMDSNH